MKYPVTQTVRPAATRARSYGNPLLPPDCSGSLGAAAQVPGEGGRVQLERWPAPMPPRGCLVMAAGDQEAGAATVEAATEAVLAAGRYAAIICV